MLSAEAKPLLLVLTKLAGCELAPLRVGRVVVGDLGMAIAAEGNCVPNSTTGRRGGWLDVVNLDLHATVAVADTAAPMAGDKEGLDLFATKLVPPLTIALGCHRTLILATEPLPPSELAVSHLLQVPKIPDRPYPRS